MSETVKLIIEIPKWEYEQACKFKDRDFYAIKVKAIQNGTPLDDVKAEIDRLPLVQLTGYLDKDDAMQILDNIGKAESEEKSE